MKKIFTTLAILLIAYFSRACYADFNFGNGCVGDTVFFQALDGYAAYSWDYGDTTSGAANISHDVLGYHVYTAPGDYYVTLFVNIGAEWDYRTNLIHIGTNCFAAGFTSTCMSNLGFNFSDLSTGQHSSQFWDFGDGNTDTALAAYHYYTAEGNYNVTYIINNGLVSDTTVQVVHADSTCLSGSLLNITAIANCVGTPVGIYGSFSQNVTNYFWNFGDPASGIANYSTAIQPTHTFATPGNYLVSVIYTDGTTTDTLTKMFPVIDCNVWPGDANNDGEVNGEDIFPLGIYYGQHGNQRSGATNNWSGQACASWNNVGLNYMYLQDLEDKRTSDCNGDSTINAADVAVIQANYGRKHTSHNNRSAMLVHSASDPTLAVQLSNNNINAGSDITATISLGSASIPFTGVYGGSFTLLYDASKVDANALVAFNLSWFDTTGNSLITFYHEDYSSGKLEIAFVKTNLNSQSGYGPIATVTFHSKSTANGAFDIQLDGNAKIINTNQWDGSGGNQEVFKDMYLQGASATIHNTTGVSNVNQSGISIYPNPSNGCLFVSHEKLSGPLSIDIVNSLGEKIMSKPLTGTGETESVQLSGVASGLYYVLIKNAEGTVMESKKVVVVQ